MTDSADYVHPDNDGQSSILDKAFAILDVLDNRRPCLPVSTIMHRTGLPKSTTYRVLGTLLEMEAIERYAGGYRLGRRVLTLGMAPSERALRELALPHLHALHRRWAATVHFAVPDGQAVLFLEKLCSSNSVPTPVTVGCRLPARSTAVGKVLLAHSAEAQSGGIGTSPGPHHRRNDSSSIADGQLAEIAYDRGYLRSGLSCVATPVYSNHVAIAAISFAYPSSAGDAAYLVGPLREAARMIGRDLIGSTGHRRMHLKDGITT